jgi:hypothetical protein
VMQLQGSSRQLPYVSILSPKTVIRLLSSRPRSVTDYEKKQALIMCQVRPDHVPFLLLRSYNYLRGRAVRSAM